MGLCPIAPQGPSERLRRPFGASPFETFGPKYLILLEISALLA